ncbi:MAG: hypothetical protein ACYT04_48030 [Nostoc sp.]
MTLAPVDNQDIAAISYDDSINGLTQPYIVTSGIDEVFRLATYAGCERFIQWHGYVLQDEQEIAQAELDQYIEQQSQEVAPLVEIDSVEEVFGTLYRVWSSYHFLGTFYQSLEGCWISQPYNTTQRASWASDTQAIAAILAA